MTDPLYTDDRFITARVALRQRATGHRAGSDAVLLAATVPPDFNGVIVDAGSASGAVGLMAAWRAKQAQVRLIDIDQDDLAFADQNIMANHMTHRVSTLRADLLQSHARRSEAGLCAGDADLVLSNPPFLDEGQARISSNEDRVRAHVMPEGGLEKWILACLAMLKANGILTLIHRADRLDAVIESMKARFGDLAILPIHPHASENATRILVSGKRNSRAPLRLLPALVLHADNGSFTSRTSAIHAGDAPLMMR